MIYLNRLLTIWFDVLASEWACWIYKTFCPVKGPLSHSLYISVKGPCVRPIYYIDDLSSKPVSVLSTIFFGEQIRGRFA